MDKIKKQRMTILMVLFGIIILNLIFSIVKAYDTFNFEDWIYKTYGINSSSPSKVDIKEPSLITLMIAAVIIFLIWALFVGLAFKYAISNSTKIQGRKWPYIVLLISGIVIALFGIYGITQDGHGTIKLNANVSQDIRDAIYNKLDTSYGAILIMSVLVIVAEVAIAATSILALILISKMNAEKDMQMTNEVVQTGMEQNQKPNDLP